MTASNSKKIDIGQPVPGAAGVFVFGIVAMFVCFLLGLPGIICGIVSLVKARDCKEIYNENPNQYWPESYDKVRYGVVMAWIGLVIGSAYLILLLVAAAQ